MAQNIEIPVNLGLQNAYNQAADLRKILQESVNVKSDAFRDIQRLLDKITNQADGLKGKMGEAFKTPSGSKSFLKQYEQLFSLIDVAKEKMTSLKLEDISFSGADLDQVEAYQSELQTLRQEIDTLSKGKIGNIFEGDTIANAEKVRNVIEHLHLDSNKLTFSGLSAAIGKELDDVNDLLAKSQSKLNEYKNSIQALNGAEYTNLQQKMQEAISGAIDSSKSTFKTENLVKYSEALEQFYHNFSQLKVDKNQTGEIIGGGNISKFIDQEGNAIKVAAEKMKQQIQSYADALYQLENLKNAPVKKGVVKKDEAKKIADELGLAFDNNEKTEVAINNLQERIREAWEKTGFENFNEVNEYADKMLKALGDSFDKADLNQYINPKQLSNQLKNIFSQAGIDLKDTNISAIFNSINANMDIGNFFQEAIQHMQDYQAAKEALIQSEQSNNDTLVASQKDLEAANAAVTAEQSGSDAALSQKRDRVEEVIEALRLMVQAVNDANGAQMDPNTSGLENGRNAINSYIDSLTKLQQKQKSLGNIQMAVNRWMGFWQVLNMTKSAINDMKQHIQELDTVMTSISVVTNFSQEDLWEQISQYSEIARQYGVAIKGVYEVSQIYYQQGLQQNDVMTLTTETLKMARIAGLDYATAADYMTTAIRGFKLEMTDAAHVTDVFSALAATTASSTEEIAVAISKTAASAEAVGASFEATSAMMATMIATTRESATNIGTALKSVISRYGEMTGDPSKTVDSEGEEMSLNRVDKALQTVGITIHDTAGQFRDFDDVMLELMEKWDSLDSLSQRYIATLMAGNRQQSRFLALVSNVDAYKKALQTAMDSEGTGELQTLKTLDSIDARIEKMKVTIQEFYTSSGLEEMYKSILDMITNVISAANDMPKVFGKIPVQALAVATSLIAVVKNALQNIITNIQASLQNAGASAESYTLSVFDRIAQAATQKGQEAGAGFWQRFTDSGGGRLLASKIGQITGQALSLLGATGILSGATQYGASTSIAEDKQAGTKTVFGGLAQIAGSTASGAALGSAVPVLGTVVGAISGLISGIVTALPSIITGVEQWNVSIERAVQLADKYAKAQNTEAQRQSVEVKNLESVINKYKTLADEQYKSSEALEEFKNYMNQLADSYPMLISNMDEAGNYIIELSALETQLATARQQAAIATANATQAELNRQQERKNAFKEVLNSTLDFNEPSNNYALMNGMGYNNLRTQVKKLQTIDSSLSTEYLTGFDSIENLNTKQVIEASNHLRKVAQDYINYYTNAINGISTTLVSQTADVTLNNIINTSPEKISFDLDQYSSLIKTLVSGNNVLSDMAKVDSDKSRFFENAVKQETEAYIDYFNMHTDVLKWANNLNLDQVSSNKELETLLRQNIISDDNSSIDEELYLYYVELYRNKAKTINEQFISALQNNLIKKENGIEQKLVSNNIYNQFNELGQGVLLNGEIDRNDDIVLIAPLLAQVQSLIPTYAQMIEKTPILANNYLSTLANLFTIIAQTSGTVQNSLIPVLTSLDIKDSDSLSQAIEQLEAMGDEYAPIIAILQQAQKNLVINVKIQAESIRSGLGEYASEVEKVVSNFGKELTYSEALKSALSLLENNSSYSLDQLLTQTENGKWKLTDIANNLQLQQITQKQQDAIEKVKSAAIQQNDVYESIITGPLDEVANLILDTDEDLEIWEDIDYDKVLQYLGSMYSGEELTQAQTIVEQAYNDWADKDESVRGTFIDYLINQSSDLENIISQLELESSQIESRIAGSYLKSFDYKSLMSGGFTASTKSDLKTLLSAVATDNVQVQIDKYFDDVYEKLITGKIDEYNKQLEYWGLSDYKVSEDQANRARFESLTSLYEKIASGDIVWDALTEQEQTLLNSVEGVNLAEGASAQQVGAAADNVWAAIIKLIQAGAGTLNEVADTIAGKADKAFKDSNAGKQYNLLTSYKDGFTSSEAQELGLLNNDGTLKAEFTSYLERDSNGNWVAKAGQNAASVINYLASKLNISIDKTTDEYKDAIKTATDEEIAKNESLDWDKGLRNTLKEIFSGQEGDQINISGLNARARSRLSKAGYNITGNILTIGTEQAMNNAAFALEEQIKSGDVFWEKYQFSAKDVGVQVRQLQATIAQNAAFEGIIGEQFNQSAAEALSMALQNTTEYSKVQSLMTEMGFKWDQAAQVWKASAESIEATRSKIRQSFSTGEIDNETYLNLIASLNETAEAISPKTKQDNALLDMLQNYNNVSEAMRAAFINNFYQYGIKASDFLTKNDNGTYDVNVGALKSFLDSIGFEYDEAAKSEIEAITDSYLSNIQTAAAYSTQGASSLADIEAFRQSYADIVHESLNADAFQYDSLTQSFILDPAAMHKYIDAQKEILTGMGYTEEFVNAYITDQTDKAIQASIELDGFLNANTSKQRNDEANKLIQQIRGLSNYQAIQKSAYISQNGNIENENVARNFNKLIEEEKDLMVLRVLESGGQDAVDLLKQIKPDASADELSSVYSNAINRLNDALSDAGEFIKGSMINTTSKLYQVLRTLNPEGVNADGVITATYDMVEVYTAIYAEMSETAGVTTAGLNDAYAKLLTAHDQVNIDITDTLRNGAGMSYADFGNLLAKYDIKFEEYLTEHWDTIMLDGFGNVRITNWDAFAKDIWGDNLDQVKNTAEYTSAFKAYNDGLIELNQNTEKNIKNEILQISDAKAGDQLNLSYLWTALQNAIDENKVDESDVNDQLKTLQAAGASYVDGILAISKDANILIINDILNTLSELSGMDLGEDGQAEIKDAIDTLLKNIASLISNGAKGSLTNADAASLSQWYRSNAKNYPGATITELDFTKTAEGLQLTETSLANIYDLMKRIDGVKADALLDDIISSRESFQSLTGALREFNDAMRLDGIDDATNKLKNFNGALSNTAQMMQDVVQKAMTSPDSMNFMSNKLPDDIQTAVNAWENGAKAIKTLTQAQKSGYMGVQDFYNIVNTASSLMTAAGKEFAVAGKDAATLLQEGAENVKVVDGKLTVDISSAGLNIQGSVGDLKKNLTTGINELASAEIAIIDAEIQVLEILAAMEQMGDMVVDIDNDGLSFEISDIFDDEGNFTEGENSMQAYLTKLQEIVGTEGEIADAFKKFQLGTTSLYELIHGTAEDWKRVFGSEENVSKFMQKFSKGIEGWDLENNPQQQVLEFMKGLGQDYSIDLGDSGVFHVNASGISYVIDYSDEERMSAAQEAAKSIGLDIGKTDEEFKSYLKKLVERGNTKDGKTSELTFEENFVLKVAAGQIEVVEDEKTKTKQYKVGGKLYNNQSVANAAAELIQAGARANWENLSKREIDLGDTEKITGTMTVGKAEIEVTSDGKGNITYQTPGGKYTGSSLDELYTNWFEGETEKSREENGLEFKKWQVKQGISVETIIDINGKEGNAKTNKDVRAAIQKVIDEGLPDGKINYGEKDSKSIEVDIGNNVKLTIPKEKLEFKNGEVIPESLQEYLRDNYNTIDLDLKDTISSAITEAFKGLKTEIDELDSKPLTEIADAISTIATAIDDLSKNKGIETLNEELDKLDTETLEAIGTAFETISNNLQTLAVNGNWVILTVALTLINTLLTSINDHSNVFEIIATSLSTFPTDVLDTIKNTLMEMAGALENIDAKRQIQLDIKADGLDTILSKLQEIVASLEKLTGANVTVNNNGESEDTGNSGNTYTAENVDISNANVTGEATGGEVNAETVNMDQANTDPIEAEAEVKNIEMPETKGFELEIGVKVDETPIDSAIAKATSPQTLPVTVTVDDRQVQAWQPPDKTATVTYTAIFSAASGLGNAIGGAVSGLANKLSNAWGRVFGKGGATGNAGLAKAKGTSTLMGELGPELVVSNGRYFIAGQNGAEMVDLADDAIVFNHLQTEQLLKKGVSSSRGKAITSEQNAVAFAKGNINGGPAMASASAALAALKQLRAMWESLKSAKVSDLAGAGGGGGGGGGGSSNKANIVEPGAWIDTVERWYDLTQKIAKLEKEITYQEQIRSKISSDWQKDGAAYFRSQEKSLTALREQIRAQEQLNISRQTYFNERVAALKDEAISRIYTIDNEGQLKFTTDEVINGKKGGMEFLTDLYGFNNLGKANYTNKEKYDILQRSGFGAYMKYDSNGQEIKPKADNDGTISEENWESFYESATEAFRDRLDSISEATQSLWDSIQEGNEELEKLETDRNGILEEIRENQMDVEQSVLDAIISTRQRAIDEMQETRDALQDSTDKYIEGLNDALQKERQMYETQESQAELTRKQRQLGILQRSGGSASEIKALADDIKNSERDLYFELQQQQIDQLQETADLQIERMDTQINLMTELLEFEKTYGLLWDDVYAVMEGSAEQIANFCIGNNAEFWTKSPLATEDTYNNLLFGSENWTAYREEIEANGGSFVTGIANVDTSTQAVETQAETIANILATEDRRQQMDREYTDYDKAMKAEYGQDYDKSGKYKKIFETEYMNGRSLTEATEVARKQYYTDVVAPAEAARRAAEEEAARKAAAAATPAPAPASSGGGGGNSETKCADCAVNCGGACYNACQNGCAQVCRGNTNKLVSSNLGNQTCEGNCTGTAKGHVGNFKSTTNKGSAYSSGKDDNKTASRKKYVKTAAGGYVNHGYYELGERGTETVLTASQTQVLRNNILSDRPSSLISLLKTYNEGFSRMNNATSALSESVQDNSVTIEKVDLNMNVQQLSNDYDAKRAGDQVLSEILRVAKKTSAANSVRR